MINLLFTIKTSVAHGTLTEVSSVRIVSTPSTIEAGAISTSHGTQLTVSSIEARRTGAAICVLKILWKQKELQGKGVQRKGVQRVPGLKSLWLSVTFYFLVKTPKYINSIILTVQLPPFLQGLSEHSLTSISQLAPVKPGLQAHV